MSATMVNGVLDPRLEDMASEVLTNPCFQHLLQVGSSGMDHLLKKLILRFNVMLKGEGMSSLFGTGEMVQKFLKTQGSSNLEKI